MDLVTLRSQIEETNRVLVVLERDFIAYPQRTSLALEIESLIRRREKLEAAFAIAADQLGQDVCSYRMFGSDDRRPSVRAMTKALSAFQNLVTLTYDGLVNRPKERGRANLKSLQQTDFEFSYSSPGSLIVNLTIANERLLGIDSHLDEAIATVFEMSRAGSPADIRCYAEKAGQATVHALYNWVDTHVDFESGVDVEWKRKLEVRSDLVLQQQEFQYLKDVIDDCSEDEEEEFVVTGWLTGADVKTKQFRFLAPEGEEITGKFDDAIGDSHHAEIPYRYEAHLTKKSRIRLSTDTTEEEYFLKRLTLAM